MCGVGDCTRKTCAAIAFRLKPNRSPAPQFARIVRKELMRAADEMDTAKANHQAEDIHSARKRVKEVRAILRLPR